MDELLTDSELPEEWNTLDKDDRSSTIAWFKGGYEKGKDGNKGEILIWLGAEDDNGKVHIETNDEEYVKGKHKYVVEVLYGDTLVDTRYAKDIEEAYKKASQNLK